MVWIKSFHIIAMVAWFAGLFYLPRLFVYHSQVSDAASYERFTKMEYRLYFFIMLPAALITLALGISLLHYLPNDLLSGWMHVKLSCVFLLILFHLYCGKIYNDFKLNKNKHSSLFYRFFNELPTVLLISIILLTEIKPF